MWRWTKLIKPYFDFNPFSNNNNYIEEDIKIKEKIEENIKDVIYDDYDEDEPEWNDINLNQQGYFHKNRNYKLKEK